MRAHPSLRPRGTLPTTLLLAFAAAACGQEVRTDAAAPTDADLRRLATAAATDAAGASGAAGAAEGTDTAPRPVSSVLYSEHDAELRARIDGVVVEIVVELGDRVRAGQLLGRLEDGEQRAAVLAAEAAHDHARAEHERLLPLAERGMVEAAQVDRALYRVRSTAAELELARARHAYTRIRAPFDGVVARRHIRTAETVAVATPLFRVTALRPLRVRVMVPEHDALRLEPGRRVGLEGAAGHASARVFRIAPAVDPAAGTREVLLDVDRPGPLTPGAAVRLDWSASTAPAAEAAPGSAARPRRGETG